MLGCGALLLALVGLYATWVSYPPSRHQLEMQQAAGRGRARFDALQQRAADPAQNGWLDPAFLPVWRDNAPSPLLTWAEAYSSRCRTEVVDHRGLLDRKDAAYLAARRQLAGLLPGLHRTLEGPVFTAPQATRAPGVSATGTVGLWTPAFALQGYAESLRAEHRIDEAVLGLLPGLHWGRTLQTGTSMMDDLVGLSIQALTEEGILYCLAGGSVRPATWRALAAAVAESVPPSSQAVECLEGEIDLLQAFYGSPAHLSQLNPTELRLFQAPGCQRRHRRIFDNLTWEVWEACRQAEVPAPPPAPPGPRLSGWWEGRNLLDGYTLGENIGRLARQFALGRRRLAGLYGLAALELYRSQHGRYPDRLDELELAPLPNFPWNGFDYQRTKAGCELLVKAPPGLTELLPARREWPGFQRRPDGLRFELPVRAGELF